LSEPGLDTGGRSSDAATLAAHRREPVCARQLRAEAAGQFIGSDAEDVVAKRDFIFSPVAISTYWSYFERKLARVQTGQQLPENRQ